MGTTIGADALVHAFDTQSRTTAHEVTSPYVVKPEVEWSMALQRGRRCTVCASAVPLT
ncbi:hypothetical protein GTY60_00620 [Streptomyces sp. SID8367]|uniref:hypothetical protein n=1 Tax=Streptomyces sp. PsTaAH-137 TaxID=1305830 RepID=UPI001369BAE5|nr:hypothetical protein [Streptomyces sp. PsTaAH-137]MYT68194.1 hypothetical protein [Streptomyces sp. SID8367]